MQIHTMLVEFSKVYGVYDDSDTDRSISNINIGQFERKISSSWVNHKTEFDFEDPSLIRNK